MFLSLSCSMYTGGFVCEAERKTKAKVLQLGKPCSNRQNTRKLRTLCCKYRSVSRRQAENGLNMVGWFPTVCDSWNCKIRVGACHSRLFTHVQSRAAHNKWQRHWYWSRFNESQTVPLKCFPPLFSFQGVSTNKTLMRWTCFYLCLFLLYTPAN